jgi:hypothetical protein
MSSFGGAVAGFFGGIAGGLEGFGHTLTDKIPLPAK